jgi:hypothetical protein
MLHILKHTTIASIFFVAFINSPKPVFGFDNRLKGFIISAGGGIGEDIIVPFVQINTSNGNSPARLNTALCLDFKIGKNFGNNFELAYVNKSDLMCPYTTEIWNNTNNIELTYYLQKFARLTFVNGSIGIALWMYPGNAYMNSHLSGAGLCFSLGVGVELIRHISAVFEYQFSRPENNSEFISYQEDTTGTFTSLSYKTNKFEQAYNTHALRIILRYTFY